MIKEVLDKLKPEQRSQLMYAFDHDIAQYVEYEHGKFIGVYAHYIKHLEIKENAGHWSTGNIRKK